MSVVKLVLLGIWSILFIHYGLSDGYYRCASLGEHANLSISEDLCKSDGRHLASIHTSGQYNQVNDNCQVQSA